MENKRKFLRMASQPTPCSVLVDEIQIPGTIADESISGAKIIGLDLLMMPFNKALSLEYNGAMVPVQARNTLRDENNMFVLGVVRSEMLETTEDEESSAMLINCYVKHQDACVICAPIHIESETQVVIQLWDGVQFRVPRSSLVPMSRAERFEMLQDPKCLQYTATMYDMKPDLHQLFDYEFGTYADCPVAKLVFAAQ